jgi:hypothetical protein
MLVAFKQRLTCSSLTDSVRPDATPSTVVSRDAHNTTNQCLALRCMLIAVVSCRAVRLADGARYRPLKQADYNQLASGRAKL